MAKNKPLNVETNPISIREHQSKRNMFRLTVKSLFGRDDETNVFHTRRQQRGSRAAGRDGKFDELRLHVSARYFQNKIQAYNEIREYFMVQKQMS